jgi:hypothetical protein
MLSRKVELRVAVLLAMALLCAQWGAQAHAYSHLASSAAAIHELDAKGRLCSDCLSFAPLLATAAGSALPSVHLPQGVDPTPDRVSQSLISRDFPAAFRSRAPPISR